MTRYTEALNGLNDAQKQAVTTTEGPVLVIAGPGTGKTQLLTTRIAHILATTDTLPQNILCLTFTESAARTMQQRLSDMIGKDAYDVTISTYHAFGSELIRRYPDYFADQAALQPVDDLGIDRIFREIVASLPYSNPLKYSDAYLSDIKTLVSDAKRALLKPADLRAVAKDNLKFIVTFSPVVSEVLISMLRVDKKSIPLFEQILERVRRHFVQGVRSRAGSPLASLGSRQIDSPAALPLTSPDRAAVVPKLSEQLTKELAEAVENAQATGKTQTLTQWKNRWLAKDEQGKFVIDGIKANKKLLAAADVYEQYLDALKARQLFDYDDMILRAVHALEANNDLRFTLQEQYLYILLDEFQDTNGAQLRLVELLTDNPVNEGRPNALAVGDDDQAIYAFQGADYSHMLRFKDMYRDVLAVPLTQNYRSHSNILYTARGIAEQIEERLHHHFPAIEKTLTAANKNLPSRAVVERREAHSDVMEYAWVTKRIRQLIDDGMLPSEIAVLAPQHKYLEPLVPFLQEAGIPLRYEKRENVLDDPAINQLLRMSELVLALRWGDQATANALWAQVLSFEFWGLPTSTIWRLSWQTNDEDRNWTDELLADEQLKPIALFFIRLSHLSGTETLETMIDYLVGSAPLDLQEPGYEPFQSPYYTHYFGDTERVDFWNLLTNLIVLRARLHEYRRDGEEHLTLSDFIEFVDAHRAAELKILNTSPYASGTEAVQLMTAFKAKGLEWQAVFVLAVNDNAWGGLAHTASARISLPPNLQFIRYAGATNDERLRLFYVAITRAKSQLYLVNYTTNYAGKTMTRLKYLDETTDDQGVTHSPLLPTGTQMVLQAEDGVPEPTTELAAYWQQRHQVALSSTDMQALLQDRLQEFQLSATHLCDFIDVANSGPQAFFLRTILRFPQAPRPGVQFGNAMHETLEWIHHATAQTGKLPSLKRTAQTFEQRLTAKRLNDHDTILFLDRGHTALQTYLAQRGQTVSPSNAVEYSFRHEGVFVGTAHLTGTVDKLIIDREAKTIQIVDYKTGRAHTRWAHDIKLRKYRTQLYFYKALVEGSHSFAGYHVTDAYLEFVEPDEDGVIHELHLDFKNDDAVRIKKLAEAVWQRVKNLDLPDITAYSKDVTGIEAFENDLLND